MDFPTSVRTCLSAYVDFTGRARRSEFWWFVLFTVIVGLVASTLDAVIGTDYDGGSGGLLSTLTSLGLFLPSIAVGARRLHDIARSGWWQLIGIIPIIGWIIVIVWFARDGEPGANQYGTNPQSDAAGLQDGQYPPQEPPAVPYGS